jgi:ubiquinone/menaquinone biosynthesis C-methylase UbiE
MNNNDFDQFAKQYDQILEQQLHFFENDNSYFAEYKIKKIRQHIKHEPQHILDFGCGTGRSSAHFQDYFPQSQIHGCDISEKSLLIARQNYSRVIFTTPDQLQKSQFDIIFLSCVLHHVEIKKRIELMKSLKNLLSPSGKIIIFEHNPYNPVTRHLVNTCTFDKDAILLKPKELKKLLLDSEFKSISHEYTLFFPQFLRWLRKFEMFLHWLPLGGQYMMIGNNHEC